MPNTVAPTLDYQTFEYGCQYAVLATNEPTLGPVTLSIRSHPFGLQDYLTPDEAILLADALRAMAYQVRARP